MSSVFWFAGDGDDVGVRGAGGSMRRYHGIEDADGTGGVEDSGGCDVFVEFPDHSVRDELICLC